jgi:hypothetical protein
MPCPSLGPKLFWTVQIILVEYQSFWTCPIRFKQVQIKKICPEKSDLNLTKMIWTQPNQIELDQNNLYLSKTISMVQNNFGPIE